MSDDARTHRAQLADMALEEIVGFLVDKGFAVTLCKPGYRVWTEGAIVDRLPAGYPPMVDADLPFDGEDRRG